MPALAIITATAASALAALVLAAPAAAAASDREDRLVVFNADVYVQGEFGQLEDPDDQTPAEAPLFNVVGTGLGVSWGEFSSATATSRAKPADGGRATDFKVRADGLIPNGVYSLFYVTFGPDSRHPQCETGERGLPLTATQPERQEPDASSFVAQADGTGDFRGEAEGDVLAADRVHLILIYHFDGQTYHPFANYGEFATHEEDQCRPSYGADAMRQLIVIQKAPD